MGLQDNIDESRMSQRQAADYVSRMAAELRLIATRADLGFLAYLLGMAEEEAARQGLADPKG